MKIVINNNGERIHATLEVVDGVMIVSPKEEKVDITQFKDGDVVVYYYGGDAFLIAILKGEVDTIGEYLFIEEYCGIDTNEGLWIECDYTDAATDVRYATEEEKQKLFDALAKEGKAWDAEKKAVVDLKWKPKVGEICFVPYLDFPEFITKQWLWEINGYSTEYYNKGWCFKTKEECQEFCNRLNDAINSVKP